MENKQLREGIIFDAIDIILWYPSDKLEYYDEDIIAKEHNTYYEEIILRDIIIEKGKIPENDFLLWDKIFTNKNIVTTSLQINF